MLAAKWQAAQLEDILKQADTTLVSVFYASDRDTTPQACESAGELGDRGAVGCALRELFEAVGIKSRRRN